MNEVWKDIKGYEGLYQISNLARVKSFKFYKGTNERILKNFKTSNGYLAVKLCKNKTKKDMTIHRLVAKHFILNPEFKITVNHINGKKEDNSINNLEWSTYKENNEHARKTGLNNDVGSNSHKAKISENEVIIIRNSYKLGYTQNEICRWFGVSRALISLIVNNKRWKHI